MSTETTGLEGELPVGRVAIVASRYNPSICNMLVEGAAATLAAAGYRAESAPVFRVPGAWELSLGAKWMLEHDDVIAVVALGAVIRGETTHDEHINRAVSLSLMELGLTSGKPVAFGLLTCNTVEQAIQRSGGTVGNKGNEAADAVLEMLRLGTKVREAV